MNEAIEIIKSGAVDKFADILHKLAGPMAEELGLILGDKVRAYRQRNLSDVVQKTGTKLAQASLPLKAVPTRLLLPIIEASSLENDGTLQSLWAGLLASASAESDSLSPSFIETLKQLTPSEAVALESLYSYSQSVPETAGETANLSQWLGSNKSPEADQLAAESFERLGIIRRHYDLLSDYEFFLKSSGLKGQEAFYAFASQPMRVEDRPHLTHRLEFTDFGIRFMQACRGPRAKEDEAETI
jgi:hypothetical protein